MTKLNFKFNDATATIIQGSNSKSQEVSVTRITTKTGGYNKYIGKANRYVKVGIHYSYEVQIDGERIGIRTMSQAKKEVEALLSL